jgi:hypothetical protein
MNASHRYEFPAGMIGITTLNFLLELDPAHEGSDLGVSKQIKSPTMPHPYPAIGGMEDIRLIWEPMSRKLFCSFTSLEMTAEHRPQVCLAELDPRQGKVIGTPVRLNGLDDHLTQKNWIGFADKGRLFFIHSLQPITVLQALPSTGQVRVVSVDPCPVLNTWRGSSPLIDLAGKLLNQWIGAKTPRLPGDRWFLALVHVSDFPRYHHQFIVLKKSDCEGHVRPMSMRVTHQSPPFVFEKHDVEFTCGVAFTPDEKELVIPYSKRDNDCTCARITAKSLFSQLVKVPQVDDYTF